MQPSLRTVDRARRATRAIPNLARHRPSSGALSRTCSCTGLGCLGVSPAAPRATSHPLTCRAVAAPPTTPSALSAPSGTARPASSTCWPATTTPARRVPRVNPLLALTGAAPAPFSCIDAPNARRRAVLQTQDLGRILRWLGVHTPGSQTSAADSRALPPAIGFRFRARASSSCRICELGLARPPHRSARD